MSTTLGRVSSQPAQPDTSPLAPLRFDAAEWAGAFADLGVFVPIAVALIVVNGLSATAVLLPAGLLYLAVGWFYRLPIPVQPLKAFGAIAISLGLGVDVIAAGSLLMGATFVLLGASGALDAAARIFPRPIIRGIQLSVGLIFAKLSVDLLWTTPKAFADHATADWLLIGLAAAAVVLLLVARKYPVTLVLVAIAAVLMALRAPASVSWGPSPITPPTLSWDVVATAAVALVLPQLPLTFANSCLATADAARIYFGGQAGRVKAGRLATSLGLANLAVGAIGGMPLCHGAGGLTAHRSFGARTGGAPLIIGGVLVVLALGLGGSIGAVLSGFPVWILAALMAVAGLLHVTLLRDLQGAREWAFALAVGVVGMAVNLAVALVAGLALWWLGVALDRARSRSAAPRG